MDEIAVYLIGRHSLGGTSEESEIPGERWRIIGTPRASEDRPRHAHLGGIDL